MKMPENGSKIHCKDTNGLYLLYLSILYLRYSPTLAAWSSAQNRRGNGTNYTNPSSIKSPFRHPQKWSHRPYSRYLFHRSWGQSWPASCTANSATWRTTAERGTPVLSQSAIFSLQWLSAKLTPFCLANIYDLSCLFSLLDISVSPSCLNMFISCIVHGFSSPKWCIFSR